MNVVRRIYYLSYNRNPLFTSTPVFVAVAESVSSDPASLEILVVLRVLLPLDYSPVSIMYCLNCLFTPLAASTKMGLCWQHTCLRYIRKYYPSQVVVELVIECWPTIYWYSCWRSGVKYVVLHLKVHKATVLQTKECWCSCMSHLHRRYLLYP